MAKAASPCSIAGSGPTSLSCWLALPNRVVCRQPAAKRPTRWWPPCLPEASCSGCKRPELLWILCIIFVLFPTFLHSLHSICVMLYQGPVKTVPKQWEIVLHQCLVAAADLQVCVQCQLTHEPLPFLRIWIFAEPSRKLNLARHEAVHVGGGESAGKHCLEGNIIAEIKCKLTCSFIRLQLLFERIWRLTMSPKAMESAAFRMACMWSKLLKIK